jgi:hypothetical protein
LGEVQQAFEFFCVDGHRRKSGIANEMHGLDLGIGLIIFKEIVWASTLIACKSNADQSPSAAVGSG